MPDLPDRPDLDQLRRQARELHRAAVGGDATALDRLRPVSGQVTLSAAQLALAREHGFPSWPRLRADVIRRRTSPVPAGPAGPDLPAAPPAGEAGVSAGAAGLSDGEAEPPGGQAGLSGDQAGVSAGAAGLSDGEAESPGGQAGLSGDQAGVSAGAAGLSDGGAESPGGQAGLSGDQAGLSAGAAGPSAGVSELADADELIAGQYADRPGLRPILDAVIAAAVTLGPVTVQARKTVVSLVSPGRTFAAVQATTKTRVDLGLRLDQASAVGRLQPAKNIASGTINLRIALTGPDEVDEEVLGWLKRAYEESVAPPAPRRPARRPVPELGPLTVAIEGYDLPGLTCRPEPGGPAYRNVHVALCGHSQDRPALQMPGRPWLAIEPVPGDAPSARWDVPVTVRRGDGGFDFSGPFVRGDRSDRHLGLAWGEVTGDGTLRLFRGAKLRLADVEPGLIEAGMRPGGRLTARVRLTDGQGNPICARLRPPNIAWSVQPVT